MVLMQFVVMEGSLTALPSIITNIIEFLELLPGAYTVEGFFPKIYSKNPKIHQFIQFN